MLATRWVVGGYCTHSRGEGSNFPFAGSGVVVEPGRRARHAIEITSLPLARPVVSSSIASLL